MKVFKVIGFVFVMIFGVTSFAFSQNWFVGASADFWFSKDSDFSDIGEKREYERRTINISPEIGYKINKFDFGIYPIFQYNYMDFKQGLYSSNQSFFGYGTGLFSRYNFITFFDRLSILGRADLKYLFLKKENNTLPLQNKNLTHSIGLSISPVLEFKLSDRLSLYSSIIGNIASIGYGYTSKETKNGDEYSGDGHNFTFNLPSIYNFSLTNISLGFYVTF